MQRIWHKVRKVELKEHDAGIVEIQRVPLFVTLPLLGFGALLAFATAAEQLDSYYLPITAFATFTVLVLGVLFSLFFAVEIQVKDGQLVFGVRPFYEHTIAVSEIEQWRPLTLVPPDNQIEHEFSYKRMPIENRHGVELIKTDGTCVFIATAHPERLMHAIATAKFGATAS